MMKIIGQERLVLGESTKKSSLQEHRADAQAPYAEEGRGQLREPQAGIDPQISEWGNPAGVMSRHP